MDLLRETAPLLIGMLVPPVVMLAMRPNWSGQIKFLASFLPALILGLCTSALAGELTAGMPEALIAVIVDTSLVYSGSQLAYRLFWKSILASRLEHTTTSKLERVRE